MGLVLACCGGLTGGNKVYVLSQRIIQVRGFGTLFEELPAGHQDRKAIFSSSS